jgi:hypothetical protein
MGSPSADEYCGVYWKKLPKATMNSGVELIDEAEIDAE